MISEFPFGLFFLRHCKTQNNLNHRISGQVDSQIVDFAIDTRVLNQINVEHQDMINLTPHSWRSFTFPLLLFC